MFISRVLLFNVEFPYLPKFLFFIVFHCFSCFSLFPCFSLNFKRFQGFKSLGYSFLLTCVFLGFCYFWWNFLISPLGGYPLLTGGAGYLPDECMKVRKDFLGIPSVWTLCDCHLSAGQRVWNLSVFGLCLTWSSC